jgi:hypothetical protein
VDGTPGALVETQGIPSCTTSVCDFKPQTGLDWNCGIADEDQKLPGFFNDTCEVACSFGYFSMMEDGSTCLPDGGKDPCTLTSRCMFPEEPGDEVPFGETVCEIVSDLGKNYADQGFFKTYDVAEFLWTRLLTDVTDADACMAKIGSTAEWEGDYKGPGAEPGPMVGQRGLVVYTALDGNGVCWGYGTFYGEDVKDQNGRDVYLEFDGLTEGHAQRMGGGSPGVTNAWYMCPVTKLSDNILDPLDLKTSGSNVTWKFMGRVWIGEEKVTRSFMCILDTCPPGSPATESSPSGVEGCPATFNAVEDCERSCQPGEAPGGELALAGTPEIVQCRNRKPFVERPCEPFPCKSPVFLEGVLDVIDVGQKKAGELGGSAGDCGGQEGGDIRDGTVCRVDCRTLYRFYDEAYDPLAGSAEEQAYGPWASLHFICSGGSMRVADDPTQLSTAMQTLYPLGRPLVSSPDGVMGSEYKCLLQGSTSTTVASVTATVGLKMPQADVQMIVENEEAAIPALEQGLKNAIGGADGKTEVSVIPPLAEESDAPRRLQDQTAGFATSILRVQFVAFSPDGSTSLGDIKNSLNEFRADEDLMKQEFMAALNDAELPRAVTVLGVSMSEPQETNYVIVKESEKTLEQLTMEAMRRVALVGSGISGVVIFLCIFWQQIRPCIVCCARRLNFVRIAKEFHARRKAKKQAEKQLRKSNSLQVRTEWSPERK